MSCLGDVHFFIIGFVPYKPSKRLEAGLRERTDVLGEYRKSNLFFEDNSLPSYLVSMSLGQQGQQQQQGPVWVIIGVSFSILSTASFPPKPSTMTSINR